jgi:hypothetical protein
MRGLDYARWKRGGTFTRALAFPIADGGYVPVQVKEKEDTVSGLYCSFA